MNPQDDFLKIENLSVTFDRWGQEVPALRQISITVPSGQWVCLAGHNGSAKSTLMRAICGQVEVNSGRVLLAGASPCGMNSKELSSHVFYVHQDPEKCTARKMTILENLTVADSDADAARMSARARKERYLKLLEPIGLADRLKQLVLTLSGGERQLMALLIARLRPASLILLDEPLGGLDPVKTDLCLNQIAELHRDGKTIIQVTHDAQLAVTGGNRTIALSGGRLIYDQTSEKRSIEELRHCWMLAE